MNTQQEIKVVQDMYAPHALWFATFGDYDSDCLMGTGRTPLDAIVDLLDAEAAHERDLEDKSEQYWSSNTGFTSEGKPLDSEGGE